MINREKSVKYFFSLSADSLKTSFWINCAVFELNFNHNKPVFELKFQLSHNDFVNYNGDVVIQHTFSTENSQIKRKEDWQRVPVAHRTIRKDK